MKLQAFAALFSVLGYASANNLKRHAQILHRQAPSSSAASAPPASASASASGAPSAPIVSTGLTATNAPPLDSITFGMPTGTPLPLSTTYAAGATPSIAGAPPLPSAFVFNPSEWPAQDVVVPADSSEVKEWMKELDGVDIPSFAPTKDGSCVNDTAAAADAANRGWWTCGSYVRATDIVSCPTKFDWGVSFDDGPSPFTPNLLKYLDEKDLKATFFVVGSRVLGAPNTLIDEYMSGHEISVHTWSHRPLTSLTNEQIVGELGWTRKIIKTVLGVTPTTMRPPYGDIDDRVRAIALAMGMIPIMWTATQAGGKFDTQDWQVAGGLITGAQQYQNFQGILGNASQIDTGIIVLEHDLYEIAVDLATGYTIPAALTHNPPFKLMSIGECSKIPATDMYLETNTNTSFPHPPSSGDGGKDTDGDGKADTNSKASNNKNAGLANYAPLLTLMSLVGAILSWSLL